MALREWHTSKRVLRCGERTLVMGILNITPDSFSDGAIYTDPDAALRRVEQAVTEGADIIDVGGESTRPGAGQVGIGEEIRRTVPVIEAIARRFDIPISVDTTKAKVARAATDAGAEIINDISGLRFDPEVADVAARFGTGLILMHSRGEFREMHKQPEVRDILDDVSKGLDHSIKLAEEYGVQKDRIAIDPGIGFGKTALQNLELLANLDKIASRFTEYPILIGSSRKSFINKIAGASETYERLGGSIASAAMAVLNGANIVRVHDVAETVQAARLLDGARKLRSEIQ